MSVWKNFLKTAVAKSGYKIVRTNSSPELFAWVNDPEFFRVYEMIKPYTLLNQDRLFMLWQYARQAQTLSGEIAQLGVFRGGSARMLAELSRKSGKELHLFDTFAGMPTTDKSVDWHQAGDFHDTSLESVQKLFVDCSHVFFHPGFFPDTASPVQDKQFAFVYIDADIYQSTKDALEFFYPRMVTGGFLLFDDYRGKHTDGVEKALNEFLLDKKERPIVTTRTQCVLIKQ